MLPFELTKDTPYLALSGELWSVCYEYFNRNWSCYKGFLLYSSVSASICLWLCSCIRGRLTFDLKYRVRGGVAVGGGVQYIPRNMHTVFALLCFVVVIHWLIFPYPSGLLHWHCGNLTIAPVPAKQPWWIWINISCEFIMNDCITTTKQSTKKTCAYFLGYTVGGWVVGGCQYKDTVWQYRIPIIKMGRPAFIIIMLILFLESRSLHCEALMHVGIANPQWRGKRPRHSPVYAYVSGQWPI